jgi:hypothetical protein
LVNRVPEHGLVGVPGVVGGVEVGVAGKEFDEGGAGAAAGDVARVLDADVVLNGHGLGDEFDQI